MPEKTPEKTDLENGQETAPKKKKPIVIFIAFAILLAVCGGIFFGKKVSAHAKPHKKVVEKGPVLPLDEFLVNLNDPGDHFLKVSMALELNKEKGKTAESMKEQVAPVRDAILASLMSKHREELYGLAGREKLKAEIKQRVNEALGDEIVDDVYFTNFVTQ